MNYWYPGKSIIPFVDSDPLVGGEKTTAHCHFTLRHPPTSGSE